MHSNHPGPRRSGVLVALAEMTRRPVLTTVIVFVAAFGAPLVFRENPRRFRPVVVDEFIVSEPQAPEDRLAFLPKPEYGNVSIWDA